MAEIQYPKCKCTTSDDRVAIAESYTVRWCKFLTNMLECIGDNNNDESNVLVVCDYNMFNFVNQFCKFYDGMPYSYTIINEFDNQGKVIRSADIENGRPIVKFEPLREMAKNACKSDKKNYAKRKAAWEWLNRALDAAEYFDCDPLIVEINRSLAYILTGLDPQAIHKITNIEPEEWINAANDVIRARINASTPKLNHTELFDAIYKTIAPPEPETTTDDAPVITNVDPMQDNVDDHAHLQATLDDD